MIIIEYERTYCVHVFAGSTCAQVYNWWICPLQKMKPKMYIPGLRSTIVKLLQDYGLQTSLREGCSTILKKDWCVQWLCDCVVQHT